jgi:hypothetical protein
MWHVAKDSELRPEKVDETVRTYHEVENRVKDHVSGFRQSYVEVDKDIGPMIQARRDAKVY